MTEPVVAEELGADDMGPSDEAPFGWMIDRATGEKRPKKRPGKQAAAGPPPDLAGLKTDPPAGEDRKPGPVKRRRGRRGALKLTVEATEAEPSSSVPPFRAGPIAKGMDRLYARAGKLLRVMDPDVGHAVIAATRKESDDDTTVGEAWEELAKGNPRIRVFLLKLVAGGAWGQLFMVHAPILLALVMKEAIRKRLPFGRLVEAFLEPSDDGHGLAEQLGGINPADVQQMMAMAQDLMAGMGPAGGIRVPTADPLNGEPVGE